VTLLVSNQKKKTILIIEKAEKEYGISLDRKSNENLEWMIQNGYFIKKRRKRGTRGKRRKEEI
jgi:hypothetical protein